MTIQLLNTNKRSSYSAIDDEDVDPIVTHNKNKSNRTYILIFVIIVLASSAVISTYYIKKQLYNKTIYQTSLNGDKFQLLSPTLLQSRGHYVDNLDYGNTRCREIKETSRENPFCDSFNNTSKIIINPKEKYQEVIGFGGAFTEATANNFFKLPDHIQEKFLELYFGEDGIKISMGRISINSCDFSIESYSFDDVKDDYDLKSFDTKVTHDTKEIIPLLQKAMSLSSLPIRLVASPWSPPSWMKEPVHGEQKMTGSAMPAGLINDPRIHLAWANYFSKFVTAYGKYNVPIWAVTPQNEPEFPAPWEACAYNASTELNFINDFLGPTLERDHPDLLILAFDHNKDHLGYWTETIVNGDLGFVDGMAFHWYIGSDDRYLDGTYGYDMVNYTYHLAPNKILINTEACNCPDVVHDNWQRGERLAHDVIYDMLNYAQGWIDWNLLVDSEGGPNHLKNYCDASIYTLPDFSDIYIQPKYYYFGHISKYVLPGYRRISSKVVGNYNFQSSDVNIRAGTEVLMYECEHSVRQIWKLTTNLTVGLISEANDGFSEYSVTTELCLANSKIHDRPYIHVEECKNYGVDKHVLQLIFLPSGQIVDKSTGLCIQLARDVRESGALLELANCITTENSEIDYQLFKLNDMTGEITSNVKGLCMTAGWPFLSGIAFQSNSSEEIVVILVNEASIPTEIILSDVSQSNDLRFHIDERAIQTIIL